MRPFFIGAALVVSCSAATAQTLEQKIKTLVDGSYLMSGVCSTPATDQHGWPKDKLRECVYSQTDSFKVGGVIKKTKREAVVQVVVVEPSRIAAWILDACSKIATPQASCHDYVFKAGRTASGFQFAASGNVLEDLSGVKGVHENYSFRHGVTARISPGFNASETNYSLDDQRQIMNAVDEKIIGMASGRARYWSTLPAQFKARFPAENVPPITSAAGAQQWAKMVQKEFLAATSSQNNRLLEAWLCSQAVAKFGVACGP